MLLNDINYDIYYAGGCHEHRMLRRESWPKNGRVASERPRRVRRPRRIVGRALINLGRIIAAEPRLATTGR